MFCFPNSDRVMFSREFAFCLFVHTYARGCTCIRQQLKETVLRGTITWSEMGKQNLQAKRVNYNSDRLHEFHYDPVAEMLLPYDCNGHRKSTPPPTPQGFFSFFKLLKRLWQSNGNLSLSLLGDNIRFPRYIVFSFLQKQPTQRRRRPIDRPFRS